MQKNIRALTISNALLLDLNVQISHYENLKSVKYINVQSEIPESIEYKEQKRRTRSSNKRTEKHKDIQRI